MMSTPPNCSRTALTTRANRPVCYVSRNEGFRFGILRAVADTIAPSARTLVTSADASRGAGHEGASALQFSLH